MTAANISDSIALGMEARKLHTVLQEFCCLSMLLKNTLSFCQGASGTRQTCIKQITGQLMCFVIF